MLALSNIPIFQELIKARPTSELRCYEGLCEFYNKGPHNVGWAPFQGQKNALVWTNFWMKYRVTDDAALLDFCQIHGIEVGRMGQNFHWEGARFDAKQGIAFANIGGKMGKFFGFDVPNGPQDAYPNNSCLR